LIGSFYRIILVGWVILSWFVLVGWVILSSFILGYYCSWLVYLILVLYLLW